MNATAGKVIVRRLGATAEKRAEELLGEVPGILRRVRTLLLVLMITVPAFLLGLVVVLWRLAS